MRRSLYVSVTHYRPTRLRDVVDSGTTKEMFAWSQSIYHVYRSMSTYLRFSLRAIYYLHAASDHVTRIQRLTEMSSIGLMDSVAVCIVVCLFVGGPIVQVHNYMGTVNGHHGLSYRHHGSGMHSSHNQVNEILCRVLAQLRSVAATKDRMEQRRF